ncbi:MAG TPA: PIN domain-containing protein [Terracidiphilus sp.]|nr:PIN domain-containing protein [Terracidiphilus sp.]
MILADTSIWVEMFRKSKFKTELANLITTDQLCTHPFVVAELACGSLPNRKKTLTYLDSLNTLPLIQIADVRVMIEARNLWARGIGYTDAQLLAACLATPGTQLWTVDKRLLAVSESVGIRANLP